MEICDTKNTRLITVYNRTRKYDRCIREGSFPIVSHQALVTILYPILAVILFNDLSSILEPSPTELVEQREHKCMLIREQQEFISRHSRMIVSGRLLITAIYPTQ